MLSVMVVMGDYRRFVCYQVGCSVHRLFEVSGRRRCGVFGFSFRAVN